MKKETVDVISEYVDEREKAGVPTYGLDCSKVPEFEKEHNCSIFDVTDTALLVELLVLMFPRRLHRTEEINSVSYNSLVNCVGFERGLWDYYEQTYSTDETFNPWRSAWFTGKRMIKTFVKYTGQKTFNSETFGKLIEGIRANKFEEVAWFDECILWLAYCGVKNTQDIFKITEDMIDFEQKTITFEDYWVSLNDRCIECMKVVNDLDPVYVRPGGVVYAEHYRGSYLKFLTRASNPEFSDAEFSDPVVYMIIPRSVDRRMSKVVNMKLTYPKLFYYGMYVTLCEKFGRDQIDSFLMMDNRRKTKFDTDFNSAIARYNFVPWGKARAKQQMIAFVE